ncbi:hypothetical protein DEU56DRAFT_181458 [Suillus clintonianus]|uniref:uncharacterized protein n=1 Tax=Suillus clintonianus TaxID=1904413 RepID=UPI001B86C279|nr:uncharacterized protein DEU56DRAFT_181458 [Suillus clintonianus]KAG2145777.1 hypothetical protein DEU56DRAFT_181458 [Suillus clintonianus]
MPVITICCKLWLILISIGFEALIVVLNSSVLAMIDIKSQVPLINHDSRDSSRPSETAMSSHQPRDPSQPSAPHQHFAPSVTHSQGFASPNAPTTLHRPTLSARTHTYPSSPQSVPGRGAKQETLPSFIQWSFRISVISNAPGMGCGPKSCKAIYFVKQTDHKQHALVFHRILVASYDTGHLPHSGRSGWSDIAMSSPSSDRHLITPGSFPGPCAIQSYPKF